MKSLVNRLSFLAVTSAVSLSAAAGEPARQIDAVYNENHAKVIYVDRATKKQAFEGEFDILSGPFSEGLANVKVGDRFGFIDQSGKFVIPLQSEWNLPHGFSEGLAAVMFPPKGDGSGLFAFINLKGEVVIKPGGFDVAYDFSEGLAAVGRNLGDRLVYGFIDKSGKMVIEPRFDTGARFKGGRAEVVIGDRRAVIDKTGKYLVTPAFPPEAESTYVLDEIFKGDYAPTRWRIRIRHKGADAIFNTLPEFERYLANLPRKSVIRYYHSDSSLQTDPRWLEGADELKRLQALCDRLGITLHIQPSG